MTSRRERLVDGAVAIGLLALSWLLVLTVVDGAAERALAAGLALAHVGPLAWRRRWPVPVFAAMAVTALLTAAVGVPVVVLGPAALVVVDA